MIQIQIDPCDKDQLYPGLQVKIKTDEKKIILEGILLIYLLIRQ